MLLIFWGNLKNLFDNINYFSKVNMKKLIINGIIGRKDDPTIGEGESVFSYDDLERFLIFNDDNEFEVIIDSPGGSVEEGFKIYDKLKSLGVSTTAITANSIASIIFLAGKDRKMMANSEMIIHNAWVDAEAFSGEKLNVHTLNALAEIFAETDMKILDVYTSIAGEENQTSLMAYMAQETNLGATKAKQLGFATEIIEEDVKALSFRNRVITYSQNQINKVQMDQKEKMTTFEKMLGSLAKAFKLSVKNMVVTTSTGVELFIDGEGDIIGKIAYIAEDGIPTEQTAPEGNHTLTDGTEITVGEGGVIVTAQQAPDLDAIKASYDEEKMAMEEEKKAMEEEKKAMEEEKEELLAKITNLTKVNDENAKKVEDLQKAFAALKNEVAGDPDAKKVEPVMSNEEFKSLSPAQKARISAMNKAQNLVKK